MRQQLSPLAVSRRLKTVSFSQWSRLLYKYSQSKGLAIQCHAVQAYGTQFNWKDIHILKHYCSNAKNLTALFCTTQQWQDELWSIMFSQNYATTAPVDSSLVPRVYSIVAINDMQHIVDGTPISTGRNLMKAPRISAPCVIKQIFICLKSRIQRPTRTAGVTRIQKNLHDQYTSEDEKNFRMTKIRVRELMITTEAMKKDCIVGSVGDHKLLVESHKHPQTAAQYQPEDIHKLVSGRVLKWALNNPSRRDHPYTISNTQDRPVIDFTLAYIVNGQIVTSQETITRWSQSKTISVFQEVARRSSHIPYNDKSTHHNNMPTLQSKTGGGKSIKNLQKNSIEKPANWQILKFIISIGRALNSLKKSTRFHTQKFRVSPENFPPS